MDAASVFWGIVMFIAGLLAFIAILSIEVHTRKNNQLLRKLLEEQNPDRFEVNAGGTKLRDRLVDKKI